MRVLLGRLTKKISHLVWTLFSTGALLFVLGLLVYFSEAVLRFLAGSFVLALGFMFLFGAYRLWTIKKDIEKFFHF